MNAPQNEAESTERLLDISLMLNNAYAMFLNIAIINMQKASTVLASEDKDFQKYTQYMDLAFSSLVDCANITQSIAYDNIELLSKADASRVNRVHHELARWIGYDLVNAYRQQYGMDKITKDLDIEQLEALKAKLAARQGE